MMAPTLPHSHIVFLMLLSVGFMGRCIGDGARAFVDHRHWRLAFEIMAFLGVMPILARLATFW